MYYPLPLNAKIGASRSCDKNWSSMRKELNSVVDLHVTAPDVKTAFC